MTPAAIFAYSGDALAAVECARHVSRMGLRPVIFDDAAHRLPGWTLGQLSTIGAGYRLTTFDRRGNLNGTECCRGMVAAMLSLDAPVVVKLDADTLIVRPEDFAPGNVGCCSTGTGRRDAFGACYSIRRKALEDVAEILAGIPDDPTCPEDLTIWSAIRATGHPFEMLDHSPDGGGLAAVPVGAAIDRPDRFSALTFGNPPDGGWKGLRDVIVSLEMRRFASGIDESLAWR